MRFICFAAVAFASLAGPAPAQVFSPILVTGYTRDVIADAGPLQAAATTTSSFDHVPSNIGDGVGAVLYQQGFNTAAPARGVPVDGSIVTSPTRSYQLGPIAGNNSLLLYGYPSSPPSPNPTGSLTLATPARYAALSLLLADGIGRQPSQGGYQGALAVNWSNGNSTSYPFTVYDWFLLSGTPGPNSGVAVGGLDRAARSTGLPDNNTSDPRLFYYDIDLSGDPNYLAGALINSVTATKAFPTQGTNAETTNIMALSGAVTVPEPSTLLLAANGAAVLLATHRRKPRESRTANWDIVRRFSARDQYVAQNPRLMSSTRLPSGSRK